MDLEHVALKPGAVQFRGYQANLARIAGKKDALVVLPTGMGKTVIALLTMADAIEAGAERILLLAPTKPLVQQHGRFFESALDAWGDRVHVLTGSTPPAKRETQYKQGLVIATPQVVQNDLIAGRIPDGFDWIIYDECHRAVGEYPYTFIGQQMRRLAPSHRRLGLTASPGHDVQKIDEVRQHLGLEHVEIRTPDDPDVKEYVQTVEMEWETLPLPPTMARVTASLQEALNERIKALRTAGHLDGNPNRMRLLECGKKLQTLIQRSSEPDPSWFACLSLQAQAMKLQHALEQAQTQGSQAFAQYIENMRREADGPKSSKASRSVVDDPLVNKAYHVARTDESETPKMGRVEVLVREQLEANPDSRVIVFTHYRSTCATVVERLAAFDGVRPVEFVGQGKRRGKGGLTQKQQGEIVEQFTAGSYNVLVATSVAEEGLDIPETDLVVFYEPIPSEIRSIQRRGRTGRKRDGRVVVLMTKGTQDEAAHWSSRRKEQQMVRELQTLRQMLAGRVSGQTRLDSVRESAPREPAEQPMLVAGPRIICDAREQPGQVVKHLAQLGAKVDARTLEIADFVLSDRVAVERKAGSDFVDSLVDGRLFDQLAKIKEYPRPMLVLEGEFTGRRNVAPEALMGALASVTLDYGISIMHTQDALDTARFLLAVAKREQGRGGRRMALRSTQRTVDDVDVRLGVLRALPGVSDMRAEALLHAFGSVAAVFTAAESALAAVEGIGPKTAAEIRRIISPETLSKET